MRILDLLLWYCDFNWQSYTIKLLEKFEWDKINTGSTAISILKTFHWNTIYPPLQVLLLLKSSERHIFPFFDSLAEEPILRSIFFFHSTYKALTNLFGVKGNPNQFWYMWTGCIKARKRIFGKHCYRTLPWNIFIRIPRCQAIVGGIAACSRHFTKKSYHLSLPTPTFFA